MQKHIVRQSDIYGVVGVDFKIDEISLITQAFLTWLQQKTTVQRVVVGMDGRLTSPALYQQVTQAIIAAGYQVYFVGVCPTPVFTNALYHLSAQAGIMITGSASGPEYNGLKLYMGTQPVEGACLQEIYNLTEIQKTMMTAVVPGKIIPCPTVDQYIDSLWQEFAHLSQYQFSMVIDTGNGTMGPLLTKFVRKMGWKQVLIVHEEIDGSFPHHLPEPYDVQNLEHLKIELKMKDTAFGVAFDGDGDRLAVIDEKGLVVSSQRMIAVFGRHILARHKQSIIIHDIFESAWLDYVLYQAHGKVVSLKDHQQLLSTLVMNQKPVFVGQQYGRYFFYDRHAGYPDGLYALLRLLDILVQQRCSVHDLIVQLPRQIIKYPQQSNSTEQYY